AALEILEYRKEIVDLVRNIAPAGDDQSGLDVLLHRHGAEDLTPLRHIGETVGDAPVARQRGEVDAVDGDLPRTRWHHANQRPHQFRFAHAIAALQPPQPA